MNFLIIVCSFIAHITTAFYYYKKESISIRSFLWFYFSFFAFGSVYLLGTDLYFSVMDYPEFTSNDSISPIPYICNYFFTYFICSPFAKIHTSKIERIRGCSYRIPSFIKGCYAISLFYLMLKLFQFIIVLRFGFGNFHDLGPAAAKEYLYGGATYLLLFNYLGKYVNVVLMPAILLFLYRGFISGYIKRKTLINYFSVYSIGVLFVGMVGGSRAIMFFGVLTICFFSILFFAKMMMQNLKKILPQAMIVGYILLLVTQNITDERFGDHMSTADNVFRYIGESYLNLGFEYWNYLQNHTYGLFVFGSLLNLPPGFDLYSYIGVKTWWFTTMYGSFFIDFGPYIPIAIAFIVGKIVSWYIGDGRVTISSIGVFLFYFQFCYMVPFAYSFDPFDMFILFSLIFVPKVLFKGYI